MAESWPLIAEFFAAVSLHKRQLLPS